MESNNYVGIGLPTCRLSHFCDEAYRDKSDARRNGYIIPASTLYVMTMR